jgi:DNA repair exonuclease SbcCD ATPase subunit
MKEEPMNKPQTITQLTAENIKKLSAVNITPDGNVVVITGKNDAGKSSVIDSIFYGLTGKIPGKVVKSGEKKAKVRIETEDYIITRKFDEKFPGHTTRTLTIERDGAVLKSPQKMLDSLIGHLTFDPLEFSRLKAREQRDMLTGILGLDFTKQEEKQKELRSERTVVGRERDKAKGHYEAMDLDRKRAKEIPNKEVSVAKINEKKDAVSTEIEKMNNLKINIENMAAIIVNLEKKLAEIKEKIEDTNATKSKLEEQMSDIDISSLISQRDKLNRDMSEADSTNAQIRLKQDWIQAEVEYVSKKAEYDNLTGMINDIDSEKQGAIEASDMPVEGMTFDDNGVYIDGIPFDQLATSRKIKASMALAIAMNPTLKVILIDEGSELDSDSMKLIADMADEAGVQVWMTRVDETGKAGILIEEGEIK